MLYTKRRWSEIEITGWPDDTKQSFLDMQFRLQEHQYTTNYPEATFEIVEVGGVAAGRLYIDRTTAKIHIIDICLLSAFRNRGIGGKILTDILREGQEKSLPVTLHVEHDNPALKLYERMGFSSKNDTGVYYYMEWLPAMAENER